MVGTYVSGGQASYPSIEIDENGKLYVAYRDHAQYIKIVVKRFNGTVWEPLDGNEIVEDGDILHSRNSICVRNNRIYIILYSITLVVKEYKH